MTRLKYRFNTQTGYYESIPVITGHFSTVARYSGLSWQLISYDTGTVLCEGKAKSNAVLKKKLKAELISRGAIFQDEIRPKVKK